MSSRHIFICSDAATPTARWKEAFADGVQVDVAQWDKRRAEWGGDRSIFWLASSDGLWVQHLERFLRHDPQARVIVVSGVPDVEEGTQALGAGARGYTHAYAVPELLREVATVVEHGGIWAGPELLARMVASTAAALARLPVAADTAHGDAAVRNVGLWGKLSAREAEVAEAVAEGRSNRETAEKLFISERTVKAHLGAVFEKLGIRDRLQLVLFVASIKAQTAGPAQGNA